MRNAAHRLLGEGLPAMFDGSGAPNRALIFDRLLQGAFRLSLSTAAGWWTVESRLDRAAGAGLSLLIRLRADAPAITGCDPAVHGAEWPTRLPVLQLEVATQGRLYPYSLLARLPLAEVDLRVCVRGVREVRLANNLGPLDPTKAFAPFGPLPGLSSYLVVGSPEAARKTLDRLSLDIEWGGLPLEPGGFDTHYAGYGGTAGKELRQGQFSTEIAWLRDSQWQACANRSAHQPLFAGANAAGELIATQHIEIDPGSVRKLSRATDEDWSTMPMPRNGLCRLQLSGPRSAFGHAAYPVELAATVAANARTKRPSPLPNPPYTPVIERISLNYEAASVIALDRDDDPPEGVDGERLFHLHPFGLQTLYSAMSGGGHDLLPRLGVDGNLYIGLSSCDPGGVLTLLFQLRESSARSLLNGSRPRAVQWATLANDEWRTLAASRVLGDTTHGCLTSGIVTLDLPRDMSTDHTVMPAGLYWLRLSAAAEFDSFAGLVSVRTQGVRLRRQMPGDTGMTGAAPPRTGSAPPAPAGAAGGRRHRAAVGDAAGAGLGDAGRTLLQSAARGGRTRHDHARRRATAAQRPRVAGLGRRAAAALALPRCDEGALPARAGRQRRRDGRGDPDAAAQPARAGLRGAALQRGRAGPHDRRVDGDRLALRALPGAQSRLRPAAAARDARPDARRARRRDAAPRQRGHRPLPVAVVRRRLRRAFRLAGAQRGPRGPAARAGGRELRDAAVADHRGLRRPRRLHAVRHRPRAAGRPAAGSAGQGRQGEQKRPERPGRPGRQERP
ncbi:hypothetical protein ACFJIX_20810 [Roseateles sp. UC29_93]|uniref:hypothetical protein n=1 Tax=Roseateles sp. UC29_93 TaxID=3350177 RepID=UPI003671352C